MAPAHSHYFNERSLNSGTTFTVVFVAVAAALVVVGILWACLPHLRGKYLPPLRPSQTRYNHGTVQGGLSGATLTSDSRPNQQSDSDSCYSVATQDPQAQAPHPTLHNASDSNTIPHQSEDSAVRAYVSPNTGCHNVCKSTVANRVTRLQPSPEHHLQAEPQRDFASETRTPLQSRDFGDAKEYILAIPEPLSVKSQDKQAGLVSIKAHSSVTDGKLSSSATSDKVLHPNKLFEQIEAQGKIDTSRGAIRSNLQNSTKLALCRGDDRFGEPVDPDRAVVFVPNDTFESGLDHNSQAPSTLGSLGSDDDDDETSPHNPSIAAMHRLRTYRSLVGTPAPKPLTRAGTLTRPKTPVAEIRNLYDRRASDSKPTVAVSRNNTVSTNFGTAAGSSDDHSSISSQTSPPKTAPSKLTVSSVSLLPTPLRVIRSSENRSVTSPTPTTLHAENATERASKLAHSDRKAQRQLSQRHGLLKKHPGKLPLSNRPRPAPLKFRADVRSADPRSINISRTPTRVGDANFGLKRQAIGSMQASSVYSRDTQGQSITKTPAVTDFQNGAANPVPFTPVTPSTTEATSSSKDGTEASLVGTRDRAFEASRLIIDSWKAHMNDVQFDTSPSPSLKRALSNLGEGCNTRRMDLSADDGHNARDSIISTEFAPSELELPDSTAPALRISASSQITGPAMPQRVSHLRASVSDTSLAVAAKGVAPGNANWI